MKFLITILIGLIGSKIALKLKFPAGAMTGSLFAVAIFSVITGNAYIPQNIKIITQISTGIFLGAKIKLEDIKGLREIFFPALFVVIFMVIFNFIMGFFIYFTTDIDIITALFATAPAGITDMSIMSYDFGADSSKVAILQLIRVISVLGFFPFFIKFLIKKIGKKSKEKKDFSKTINEIIEEKLFFNIMLKKLLITLLIGTVSGIIGFLLKVPAGTMSIAMIGTALYNIFSNNAYMPLKLRQFIQSFAGALIGTKMTMQDIMNMKEIIIPILVIVIGFGLMNFILGMFIYKFTNFSIETSLFSTAPGGMSDMSIIAGELGADTPKVAVMQICRLVTIIAFYPIIINIISQFF